MAQVRKHTLGFDASHRPGMTWWDSYEAIRR
jgi:hypothetical protein